MYREARLIIAFQFPFFLNLEMKKTNHNVFILISCAGSGMLQIGQVVQLRWRFAR